MAIRKIEFGKIGETLRRMAGLFARSVFIPLVNIHFVDNLNEIEKILKLAF